jgi:exodeoxyribonuclease VII small subunit
MTKKESSYSKTIEEIEVILAKIESGETDIDALSAEIKRAAKLLLNCKEKLFQTEQEVEKILKNEE